MPRRLLLVLFLLLILFPVGWRHSDVTWRSEEVWLLGGDSTADGRALMSGLSPEHEALDLTSVSIAANSGQLGTVAFQAFDLGVNQQSYKPQTFVGPEFGLAMDMAAHGGGRIIKYAVGGSFLAPTSLGAPVSWNVAESHGSGLLWLALRQWQQSLQDMVASGVGFDAINLAFLIGLNDATNIAYAPSAEIYQGYLQALLDVLEQQFAGVPVNMTIARPHSHDPLSNPTALANVRQGIAQFAAANANVTMIDTDSFSLEPDNAHQDAVGVVAMGAALY